MGWLRSFADGFLRDLVTLGVPTPGSDAARTKIPNTGGGALARNALVCTPLVDGAVLGGLVVALAALLAVFTNGLAPEIRHILGLTRENAILMGLSLIDSLWPAICC